MAIYPLSVIDERYKNQFKKDSLEHSFYSTIDKYSDSDNWCKTLNQSMASVRAILDSGDVYFVWESAFEFLRICSKFKLYTGLGAGENIVLTDYNLLVFCALIAVKEKETDNRFFRNLFYYVPKKHAKTTMSSLLLLYFTYTYKYLIETYAIGPSLDQAKITTEGARNFIETNEVAKKLFKPHYKQLINVKTRSSITPWTSKNSTKSGFNPYIVVCDEICDWDANKGQGLYNHMKNSIVGQKDPLIASLSTASSEGDYGILPSLVAQYRSMIKEADCLAQKAFPFVCEPDEDDDWQDEQTWARVSPGLGITKSIEAVQRLYEEAKHSSEAENMFRRLQLNETAGSSTDFVTLEFFKNFEIQLSDKDLYDYRHNDTYVAFDNAMTSDVASIAVTIKDCPKEDCYFSFFYNFFPKSQASSLPTFKPYIDSGDLDITPSSSIDQARIGLRLSNIFHTYNVVEFTYDNWHIHDVMKYVSNAPRENRHVKIMQTQAHYTPLILTFKHLMESNRLFHRPNSFVDYCLTQVDIRSSNSINFMIFKKINQKTCKIDPIVAYLMTMHKAFATLRKDPLDYISII